MKLTLTFEEKDFDNFRSFEKAVEKQCGKTYVSGTYLCWYFDLPKELQTLLSPVQRDSDSHKALLAQFKNGSVSFDLDSLKPESKL